jgi:hypothetical protein
MLGMPRSRNSSKEAEAKEMVFIYLKHKNTPNPAPACTISATLRKAGLAMANQDNGDGKKNGEDPDAENPEYDNFQRLLKQVLSTPKEELDKRKAEYEREKK